MAKSPNTATAAAKKKAEKKRKSATPAPKETEDAILGEVLIEVQCSVIVGNVSSFDELVIEWGCLGLSEEPDAITENSGNSRLLDPDRPPATDEEGLHVFFKPALPGGRYGFHFVFTYNSSVEARTADPEKVKKLEEKREKFEGAEA